MELLTTIIQVAIIIFGFGVLIFVHELGHFLAAKWAGIRTEAFAVGMGPVIVSWRKGVGFAMGSTHAKVVAETGRGAMELDDEALARHGIGETEYSLRWLPIGGFVKMLGQDDLRPSASVDPRSYTRCPVGKRMVVVSAGVIMNIVLAILFFMVAFMIGVRFDAPIIGATASGSPAATAIAVNAEEYGVVDAGLLPGDRPLSIDGQEVETFSDIWVASAMARPGASLEIDVERNGVPAPLVFEITPEVGARGMLAIGVEPAGSLELFDDPRVTELLAARLGETAIAPGAVLEAVDGESVSTMQELDFYVGARDGVPVDSRWRNPDGTQVDVTLTPQVRLATQAISEQAYDPGIIGLCPLLRFEAPDVGTPNHGIVEAGDTLLRAGQTDYPRWTQLATELAAHAGGTIRLRVLRNDEAIELEANVTREGKLGILPGWALDRPVMASPVLETSGENARSLPAAQLDAPGGSTLHSIGGSPVDDWRSIRQALRDETLDALAAGSGASVLIEYASPFADSALTSRLVELTSRDVENVHALGWDTGLASGFFRSLDTTLQASNPIAAIGMGFKHTWRMIKMTYLTIDRLFRRSVSVKELRGPVGIVHLGTGILPQGFPYFLFFLGMISVNLAVINFLPLPIVDGGLFLYLVYEKIKGKAPPIAFQNAATIIGLCMIGTLFLVTFYNDIARLFS